MLSRIYLSESEKQTITIARNLVKEMGYCGVICLYGGLGTGKTVFAKGCAIGIGAQEKHIKSPTFAFIRELKHAGRVFFHCDFYRIANDDEILHHSMNEIFAKPRSLVVIEWAQNLISALPESRIDVHFEYTGKNSRRITIIEQTNTAWIYKLYKKYHTPAHVIKHMEVVADLAQQLALNLIKKGKKIDLRRVAEISLLHDLLKHKSFKNKKINDVKLTSVALKLLGRKDLVKSVLTQQFEAIINPRIAPKTLEEKIVYYADKRVKHSEIVPLRERFRDGRIRYWQNKPAPLIVSKIEKKIFALEKELMS